MNVNYNDLARFIGANLPEKGVWFQSSPAESGTKDRYGDAVLAEGLAIRRGQSTDTDPWLVVYFTIVEELPPTGGQKDPSGQRASGVSDASSDECPEEQEGSSDPDNLNHLDHLDLYVGFTGAYDTLADAKREARDLVGYLPAADPAVRALNQDLIFEAIDDLEDEPAD